MSSRPIIVLILILGLYANIQLVENVTLHPGELLQVGSFGFLEGNNKIVVINCKDFFMYSNRATL